MNKYCFEITHIVMLHMLTRAYTSVHHMLGYSTAVCTRGTLPLSLPLPSSLPPTHSLTFLSLSLSGQGS